MRELLFVRVQNAYQTKRMPKNRFETQRKMAAIVSHVCTCAENAVRSLTFKTKKLAIEPKTPLQNAKMHSEIIHKMF